MINKMVRLSRLTLLLCLSQLSFAQSASYALTNANLFNGLDDRIIENATVFVKDGRIERIATGDAAIPSGYEVIDCSRNCVGIGMTLCANRCCRIPAG